MPAAVAVPAAAGTTGVAAVCCAAASTAAALGSTAGCVVVAADEPSCDEVASPVLDADAPDPEVLPLALPDVLFACGVALVLFASPLAPLAFVEGVDRPDRAGALLPELAWDDGGWPFWEFWAGGWGAGAGGCGPADCELVAAELMLLSTSAEKAGGCCDDELLSEPRGRTGANELVTLLSGVTLNTGGLAE